MKTLTTQPVTLNDADVLSDMTGIGKKPTLQSLDEAERTRISALGKPIMHTTDSLLNRLVRLDRLGITLIRLAIALVFLWIGALKFVPYEADSITPFVSNSPFMSFFYKDPEGYKQHLTHEGELNTEKRAWQTQNHTYRFSKGLGVVEWSIGLLVLLNPLSRRLGLAGGLLSLATTFVTLSFLVTTPEAWVAPLGDANYGFPYLSGAGRLVLKDTLMLAGAVVIIADSARSLLEKRQQMS